jgi:RNA-directed DNA polymerase
MRTVNGLMCRLADPATLDHAVDRTVRGKRRRSDVAWLLFRREEVVARLSRELAADVWRPEGFEVIGVRDPKPRAIARAPIADRVVHSAVADLLQPALLRSSTGDAFACRPGYGTHRAVIRLKELMTAHRYVLQLDVRAYFPSIDVGILRRLLRRRVRDRRFLAVVDLILDSARGLYSSPRVRRLGGLRGDWPPPDRGIPVGTATSQALAAHLYLCEFDHYVKRTLKVPGYVRFVDDLYLFGDSRVVRRWRSEVSTWLEVERHLRLKNPDAPVRPCTQPLHALGHVVGRDGVRPRARTLRRFTARAVGERSRKQRRRHIESAGGLLLGP